MITTAAVAERSFVDVACPSGCASVAANSAVAETVSVCNAHINPWLAVWLSGNALASINVVALRQTRLVLGWVTVCGRVNYFGM